MFVYKRDRWTNRQLVPNQSKLVLPTKSSTPKSVWLLGAGQLHRLQRRTRVRLRPQRVTFTSNVAPTKNRKAKHVASRNRNRMVASNACCARQPRRSLRKILGQCPIRRSNTPSQRSFGHRHTRRRLGPPRCLTIHHQGR